MKRPRPSGRWPGPNNALVLRGEAPARRGRVGRPCATDANAIRRFDLSWHRCLHLSAPIGWFMVLAAASALGPMVVELSLIHVEMVFSAAGRDAGVLRASRRQRYSAVGMAVRASQYRAENFTSSLKSFCPSAIHSR